MCEKSLYLLTYAGHYVESISAFCGVFKIGDGEYLFHYILQIMQEKCLCFSSLNPLKTKINLIHI
jgi:hypothetical protein